MAVERVSGDRAAIAHQIEIWRTDGPPGERRNIAELCHLFWKAKSGQSRALKALRNGEPRPWREFTRLADILGCRTRDLGTPIPVPPEYLSRLEREEQNDTGAPRVTFSRSDDGFPIPNAVAGLRRLIDEVATRSSAGKVPYQDIYIDICEAARLYDGYRSPPRAFEELGVGGVLDYLANQVVKRRFERLRWPLLEFAWRVAECWPGADEISDWIDDTLVQLQQREIEQDDRDADPKAYRARLNLGASKLVGAAANAQLPDYLVLGFMPDGGSRFHIEARLLDALQGEDRPLHRSPVPLPKSGIAGFLQEVLEEPDFLCRLGRTSLHVELFLPRLLLGQDPHGWTLVGSAESSLQRSLPLAVRSWERITTHITDDADDAISYRAKWHDRWSKGADRLTHRRHVDALCSYVSELDAGAFAGDSACVDASACLHVLRCKPDAGGEYLHKLLCEGVGVAFWTSGDQAADWALLKQALKDASGASPPEACLADLPAALARLREQRPEAGPYHLLWDDPGRTPAFSGSDADDGNRLTAP
jgi:hypothetical protein